MGTVLVVPRVPRYALLTLESAISEAGWGLKIPSSASSIRTYTMSSPVVICTF